MAAPGTPASSVATGSGDSRSELATTALGTASVTEEFNDLFDDGMVAYGEEEEDDDEGIDPCADANLC